MVKVYVFTCRGMYRDEYEYGLMKNAAAKKKCFSSGLR